MFGRVITNGAGSWQSRRFRRRRFWVCCSLFAKPALAGKEGGRLQKARESAGNNRGADELTKEVLQRLWPRLTRNTCSTTAYFTWKYRLPNFFWLVTIGMFNQLSGINAILYYPERYFGFAGYSKVSRTCRRCRGATKSSVNDAGDEP